MSESSPPSGWQGVLQSLERGANGALRDLLRRASEFRRGAVATIEHATVVDHVREAGGSSARFVLMVVLSAGIAIIGLLQNSPAVIIGAMLVSPLMGPIVALGFALTTIDYRQLRRSLAALGIGVPLALAFTMLLVELSPLQLTTSEILARTEPNTLDLLVAVLSGLAGGYATVNRKGEAIVGVAIATALMPPLAVVGFGLATGNSAISGGAALLFMTNLLAIAISVAGVARWYRFTTRHSPELLYWQTALTLLVFVGLSIPLGLSLGDITRRGLLTITAGQLLEREFAGTHSRIDNVAVDLDRAEGAFVSAVVLTPTFRADAERDLSAELAARFGIPVEVSLDQIVVAREDVAELLGRQVRDAIRAQAVPPRAATVPRDSEAQLRAELQALIAIPTLALEASHAAKRIRVVAAPDADRSLGALRHVESALREHFPGFDVRVIPPASPLPSIFFEVGSDEPRADSLARLEEIAWALHAWEVHEVTAVGNASRSGVFGANASLALRRADAAAARLRAAGLQVRTAASFPAPGQRQLERRLGSDYFQRVDFLLAEGNALRAPPVSPGGAPSS